MARPDAKGSWASSEAIRRTMQGNRRSDTKPEMRLRSELHRRGLRFRKDVRIDLDELRVRPDVVFTRARLAVFVDGCFWHRCPLHATDPRANDAYWRPKLLANVERDRKVDTALKCAGWRVLRIWEHEGPVEAADRVSRALRVPRS